MSNDEVEVVCGYCSWTRDGNTNNQTGMCEGRWCKEANENYQEEKLLSEQEESTGMQLNR